MDRIIAVSLLSTAGAFAPSSVNPGNQIQQRIGSSLFASDLAAVETPPSPLTEWGAKIPNIRESQQQMREKELPEFGPEISASDLGIASDDKAAQLAYFKENAMEIKQKQEILETADFQLRAEILIAFIESQLDVMDVDKRIRNRVKGQMENKIKELGFESVNIFRPSHLLGEREKETTLDVKIFEFFTNITGNFLFGWFKKYKNIQAQKLASAMYEKSNKMGNTVDIFTFKDFS